MTERKIRMTKKCHRSIKALLAPALALVLCLCSMTTAFAAPGPITGTEAGPAQAVITKALQMPEGTVTPAETFTFAFAKKDVDGDNSTAAQGTMPTITGKTVTFAASDTGTAAAGVKTVTGETASLFAGVTWPHAGVYTYTVTETAGSSAGMTYSQASYDISVYVANGSTSGSLYVAGIGTNIVTTDTGTAGSGKTDPTTSTTVTGASSAMMFTNIYIETPTGVDPAADDMLSISKTVDGAYGDRTRYFPFSVTLNKAELVTGTPSYKAYVMEGTTVATTTANYATLSTDPVYGAYIDVTAGTPVTINLKHGQWLSFVGMPVGTTYSVTETGVADYTPSVSVVTDGGAAAVTNGTQGTALTVGSPTAIVLGANANSAAFTNTYKTVTPTGIALDNLPFIMIIVLAMGVFAAFIVVRSRRRA